MLLEKHPRAFDHPDWLFELKFDGYRLLAEVNAGRCVLRTRGGIDATAWFPEITQSLATLKGHHIFDGEACVLDELGRSDFDRLHARARRRAYTAGDDPVVFCAFDILVVRGKDISAATLQLRKRSLLRTLGEPRASVLAVDGIIGRGVDLYESAVALELEGVVAKRLSSPYQFGARTRDWLKIKRPGAVPPQRFNSMRGAR